MKIRKTLKEIAKEAVIKASSIGMKLANDKLGLKDDNLLEEFIEKALEKGIKKVTGKREKIDLTPDSPESE